MLKSFVAHITYNSDTPTACRATDNCLNLNISLNILLLGLKMYYDNV